MEISKTVGQEECAINALKQIAAWPTFPVSPQFQPKNNLFDEKE